MKKETWAGILAIVAIVAFLSLGKPGYTGALESLGDCYQEMGPSGMTHLVCGLGAGEGASFQGKYGVSHFVVNDKYPTEMFGVGNSYQRRGDRQATRDWVAHSGGSRIGTIAQGDPSGAFDGQLWIQRRQLRAFDSPDMSDTMIYQG